MFFRVLVPIHSLPCSPSQPLTNDEATGKQGIEGGGLLEQHVGQQHIEDGGERAAHVVEGHPHILEAQVIEGDHANEDN